MDRDHSQRAQEIEKAARELLSFHDSFVASVKDGSGNELGESGSGEWTEEVEALRNALRPVEN
jgi:hypothetical protein